MIYEIHRNDYCKVSYLMEGIDNFPEVHAIINNNNPGKIYADNREEPKSALIWNQGIQGFYFVGDDKNHTFLKEIKEYIDYKILDELKSKQINYFEISGVNTNWNIKIEDLFVDRKVEYGYQVVYLLNKIKFEYNSNLLHSFDIRKVDKNIFDLDIKNIDFVINELKLFWGTVDNFLQKGSCYYAIEDKRIVSICYSGFEGGKVQTIGIETLEEYKRKGYAYTLAYKFIEEFHGQDIIPYWDCSENNIASNKLARKLGFEKKDKYRCYWFKI